MDNQPRSPDEPRKDTPLFGQPLFFWGMIFLYSLILIVMGIIIIATRLNDIVRIKGENVSPPAGQSQNATANGAPAPGVPGSPNYNGPEACPVGPGASAAWGPVTSSNPHVPTYPGHEGVDIIGPRGTPVYSVTDGTVLAAGYSGGNRIWIDDHQGHYWFYQHMQANLQVSKGQEVKSGQLIGYISNTGAPQAVTHLHLGVAKQPFASTGGASQMRWDLWYYPYDFLHSIPCIAPKR